MKYKIVLQDTDPIGGKLWYKVYKLGRPFKYQVMDIWAKDIEEAEFKARQWLAQPQERIIEV